jgi:vacuolar protein 8
MTAIYRYCCAWCLRTSPFPPDKQQANDNSTADPDDDELNERLMDENESDAVSDLLLYLENVHNSNLKIINLL